MVANYRQLGLMIIYNAMKTVKICEVEIPIIEGPVGITWSGGTDSTLMLYILMKNVKSTIHVFTLAAKDKRYFPSFVTPVLLEKLIAETRNNNIIHHLRYVDIFSKTYLTEDVRQHCKEKRINSYYTGFTANPPLDVADSFCGPRENSEKNSRDPLVNRSVINQHPDDNYFIFTPFTNINKQKISEIYSNFNIIESIFPYTRSCESTRSEITYKDHCLNCWWCKERLWGFRQYIKL